MIVVLFITGGDDTDSDKDDHGTTSKHACIHATYVVHWSLSQQLPICC